jgi:hypothetical protein
MPAHAELTGEETSMKVRPLTPNMRHYLVRAVRDRNGRIYDIDQRTGKAMEARGLITTSARIIEVAGGLGTVVMDGALTTEGKKVGATVLREHNTEVAALRARGRSNGSAQ